MNTHFNTIIVGGGISGLTIAHKLNNRNPGHRFLVLEKASNCGGVIATHREDGFIAEIGPHGFLDNCPESRELLQETGLDQETVKAPLIDFVRYVFLNDQLNLIPQTPGKILKAPLIPWSAKFRVLQEFLRPPLAGEPTVAKWINHRFGPALLPYFDAIFTGTYAGDFNKLTIDSVMPGLRDLEKTHGSVLKGVLSQIWAKRKNRTGSSGFQMPAMTSFPNGMQRLVERLAESLSSTKELLTNCPANGVRQTEGGWKVETAAGQFSCRNIVMALPVNRTLQLLNSTVPSPPIAAIPEAWIVTVAMGFRDSVTIPPGFGFLTPEVEKRFALGCLFSSNMFPGRAPEGTVLIETLVGGRRHPEKLRLDEKTIVREATQDIREILGINEAPIFTRLIRSDGGIPQLEKGYPSLLRWRKELETNYPGLFLCGFGWDGIGLNDMIKFAGRLAEKLLQPETRNSDGPEVKGIYF